jgi:trimeric autotransporter adhesin
VDDARRRILALYRALPPLYSTSPVRLPDRVLTVSPVNDSSAAAAAAAAGSSSGTSLKRPSPSNRLEGSSPQKQARLAFPALATATVPGTVSNSTHSSSSSSGGGVLHTGTATASPAASAAAAAAAATAAAVDVPWSLKRPAALIPGALSPHNKRNRPASSGSGSGSSGQVLGGTPLAELRAEAQARAAAAAAAASTNNTSSSSSSHSAPGQQRCAADHGFDW